jgi:hypothetical protein
MTAGVLALRLVQHGDPESLSRDASGLFLSVTVTIGLLVAILVGWSLTRPIADVWRRGVAAGMAVFGTVLLTVVAAPMDALAGVIGLGAYLLALAIAAARLVGTARRAGST